MLLTSGREGNHTEHYQNMYDNMGILDLGWTATDTNIWVIR